MASENENDLALTKAESVGAWLAQKKKSLVALRLLGGLLGPFSGLLAQLDISMAQSLERKRIKSYQDFIEECEQTFPSDTKLDQLEADAFLRSCDLVSQALRYIKNQDKIKFFARLLRNALSTTDLQERDDNEQLILVAEDLSNRELDILARIASYDRQYPLRSAAARLDLQQVRIFA